MTVVFTEPVWGVINLLSLLGRMWVSCHHCFFLGGACFALLLHGFISKPAWFYGFVIKQNCFLVCFNLQGSSILFLYLQSLSVINQLINYFVPIKSQRQIYDIAFMWNLKKNGTNEFIASYSHYFWRKVSHRFHHCSQDILCLFSLTAFRSSFYLLFQAA